MVRVSTAHERPELRQGVNVFAAKDFSAWTRPLMHCPCGPFPMHMDSVWLTPHKTRVQQEANDFAFMASLSRNDEKYRKLFFVGRWMSETLQSTHRNKQQTMKLLWKCTHLVGTGFAPEKKKKIPALEKDNQLTWMQETETCSMQESSFPRNTERICTKQFVKLIPKRTCSFVSLIPKSPRKCFGSIFGFPWAEILLPQIL